MPKRKPFIAKDKARNFRLVLGSAGGSEDAPSSKEEDDLGVDVLDHLEVSRAESARADLPEGEGDDAESGDEMMEEERGYGKQRNDVQREHDRRLLNAQLGFDVYDDYDYSQYVRPITGEGVFLDAGIEQIPARNVKDEELREIAKPIRERFDLDDDVFAEAAKEVLAELERDADSGSDLEDNFITLAAGDESDSDGSERVDESVIQLEGIDEKFEQLLKDEWGSDDDSMDSDEYDGVDSGNMVEDAIDEFLERRRERESKIIAEAGKMKVKEYLEESKDEDHSEEEFDVLKEKIHNPEGWDCESVLSTLSNTENLPVMISAPKRKWDRSLDTLSIGESVQRDRWREQGKEKPDEGGDARKAEADGSEDEARQHIDTVRPENETQEERRARKERVRQGKKQRREEKKERREIFRKEGVRIRKIEAERPPQAKSHLS